MLPANLISTLRALSVTDKPLITATPDKGVTNSDKQFEIGQKLQGTVQAQVAPEVFNVKVADQVLQMRLPSFINSGDVITLQVISLQPRLTFNLAVSSNPISNPESLSATSRLLSSLSQQPLERNFVRPIQSSPLWTGGQAMPDTTQLAGKLHDALSHSGLFYESHQAQWIAGTRPTSQLLLEPQNQLPQDVSAKGVDTQTVQAGNTPRISSSDIPEHLQTLVQQQLNALETRQVLWQGQVWQGQEMRWQVGEESPQPNAQGEQEGQWITQINLNLPNLGDISTKMGFTNGALTLSFNVANREARDRLTSASTQLITALSERGIPVISTRFAENENI